MRKINNINITKAQLLSFNVVLKEKEPEVSATITLLTTGGKKITEYSISTDAWDDSKKFELPPLMVIPILAIAQELEKEVIKHCNSTTKQLTTGKK